MWILITVIKFCTKNNYKKNNHCNHLSTGNKTYTYLKYCIVLLHNHIYNFLFKLFKSCATSYMLQH